MTTEFNDFETPVDAYRQKHAPKPDMTGGKRQWLYPRVVKGRYYRWRTLVAWVLLALFFGGPFLSRDGQPLFLFNVLERKFNFFGVTFWPQDFHLVAIGMLAFIVFISLFTVVYGRVWCGWACPQTVFMEMVFRKIETAIEGDANTRKRLDAAPWTTEKLLKKGTKYTVFFLISFVISNTFLAYIIGKDELLQIITDDPMNHLGGLMAILIFTGVFYAVFAWLREIVCTTICPYGRLQGVLLDRKSVVVAYDDRRGEPRGKMQKPTAINHTWQPLSFAPKGDCIDCKLCVQVCPTGIDIRKGIQMECISCTACIDACDEVMDKIGRPQGLIRHDSLEGIQTRKPWRFSGRMMAYSLVLLLIMGVWGYLLAGRTDLETTILRAPGQLFQRESGGRISNLYLVEVVNKTHHTRPVTFRVTYPGAQLKMVQPLVRVPADELAKGMLFILLPEKAIHQNSTHLEIEVLSEGVVLDNIKTTFLGPIQ
ncbi:cytochrome c oxidase accessory protein CcoG [Spirosoma radiotolerans]|uniref:Cytochrome C oxidase n=1 Tax=Spirosoma radiotolerans TaxID=1379870 RepID=A0A0E3V984_9BACT|nr:cytochrome c oxidase accessory protein CcoG [Spirosoma radiotolerans]AKD57447.1 cytochrome C oxidase [Spirosoma radiotolerans]